MFTLISTNGRLKGVQKIADAKPAVNHAGLTLIDPSGAELGYLTENPASLIPGSKSANGLKKEDVVGNMLVMQAFHGSNNISMYKIDLFPAQFRWVEAAAQKKIEKEMVLLFGGATSAGLPGKAFILDEVNKNHVVPVTVQLETKEIDGVAEQTLVAHINNGKENRACGRFLMTQERLSFPSEFCSIGSMQGYARKTANKWTLNNSGPSYDLNYEIVITPEKTSSARKDFSAIAKKLNDQCIDHPENLEKKIAYMRKMQIPEELIESVFNSYIFYQPEFRGKIEHPAFPFQDTHEYLKRSLVYFLTGLNTRYVGDKGCGKNTLLNTMSWLMNQPLFKIGCSERTDEYVLFGSTQIRNGDTFHKLSPFAQGLICGGICLLDEANAGAPELMIAINQLADDTRQVDISGYGLLKLHNRTRICLTMNESYQGVNMMNEATVDRFEGVVMDSGLGVAELMGVLVPDATQENITICDRLYKAIHEKVEDGDLDPSCITIRGYVSALKASRWQSIKTSLEDCICGRIQIPDDRSVVQNLIDGVTPSTTRKRTSKFSRNS